jgi:ferredoxin
MERPVSETAPQWKLHVDLARCQGHNRCYLLLPELIRLDDHGFASVLGDGRVPPELVDKARLAVRNCPEFALRLSSDQPQETAT